MTFLSPAWLWALFVLPLIAALEIFSTLRDRDRTSRLVARPLWGRVLVRPRELWRWLRFSLLLVSAAGFVVALARPQWGIVREKVEREGVDIMITLDTSGSMATEDVPPNRFFLARAALTSLVERLEGDRFGLVAFEGEAYPLVPLTLDADAVGLFLETIEPGIVPGPGTSLGAGLAKGLEMFVDKDRRNKAMVLVSDGEDLEGEVDEAIRKAKEAGVTIFTVGVGTENGNPVPSYDSQGNRSGFKKDDSGSVVVSRLHSDTLEAIARGTGGKYFRIGAANSSLAPLAAAIEGMEQKSLAREYSYRGKEWFQVPLGIALASLTLALLLPLPDLRRKKKVEAATGSSRQASAAATMIALLLLSASALRAQQGSPAPLSSQFIRPVPTSGGSAQPAPGPDPSMAPAGHPPAPPASATPPPEPRKGASRILDEVLLRPKRDASRGNREFELGNHPNALQSFDSAAASRPGDPAVKFNRADALYKNGRYDDAEAIYRSLGADAKSPLAPLARYNLGNSLFQKEDYKGAVGAYRDALRIAQGDAETKRNLELALRALEKQQEQQQRQQEKKDQDKKQDEKQQQEQQKGNDPKEKKDRPKSEQEKEQERFQKETGMPKERAMQLLDALQQNEKDEQKKLLAARPAGKKKRKDW